ncbi:MULTISPECIES: hypothetical protein [unclassified Bradyrhizobium]|uniref:hypothetical protein n=1 Tax=unclassified Bradyrhizobium TaxID=2631580 RepID=UPI00247AF7D0|nr:MULTISPECIES: hypothetical protein [unclassified Bradyrhizobium]WGS18767.1 hypothetical protein MTX22_30125 [Bradyrhizobium sp. ISRA463]WGS25591.1 hypothetical protein MTX19_27700 [Bradyrhizobium sp. ISRA464]
MVTAFFGVLFGAPTLRLKGDYLAIVTLGFGEIVPIVARNTPSITNGAHGLKHRIHSLEFKRQVAQEFLAGETLHGLHRTR